jgi:hypothetical protein
MRKKNRSRKLIRCIVLHVWGLFYLLVSQVSGKTFYLSGLASIFTRDP